MARPKITTTAPASRYASKNERIAEFSATDGTGGLISIAQDANGGVSVNLYRLDPAVTVSVSHDDTKPAWVKTPELNVEINHGKGASVVTGPVRIAFQGDGTAYITTQGSHNVNDGQHLTIREREFLASVHATRNDDGTWTEYEPADHDVRPRGMSGGIAPTTYRAAIVAALLAALAEHWTPELDRAGAYAQAAQRLGQAVSERAAATEAFNYANMQVARLRRKMAENAPTS